MTLSTNLDTIQKAIIFIHREVFAESPTPMKLQKLCYYVQGYSLAIGNELFPEDFQAWQHGPVIPDLYFQYSHLRWGQINEDVSENEICNNELIRGVVSAYGRFDGAALSTMTHRETPWLSSRGDLNESEGCDAVIPKESLKDFFKAQLQTNG
jgi:uncharacterized phage-associated protein